MSAVEELRKRTVTGFVRTYLEGILRTVKCTIVFECADVDLEQLYNDIRASVGKEQPISIRKEPGKLVITNRI